VSGTKLLQTPLTDQGALVCTTCTHTAGLSKDLLTNACFMIVHRCHTQPHMFMNTRMHTNNYRSSPADLPGRPSNPAGPAGGPCPGN